MFSSPFPPGRHIGLWAGGVCLVAALPIVGRLLRDYVFIPRFTILSDLPAVGTPRKGGKIPGRAVICGGSIAGLVAAAVCADHFESVIVVEPDLCSTEVPGTIETRIGDHGENVPINPRKRVKQWFASHTWHSPAYMGLQRLFSEHLPEELDKMGIKPIVAQTRVRGLRDPHRDAYEAHDLSGGAPVTLALSREAYETLLVRLVRKTRPNVEFVKGTVTGLQRNEDRVDAVAIRGEETTERSLKDVMLVVDATGPTQAGFTKWLNAAGFGSLPTSLRDQYDPNYQVLTAIFTVPPHLQPGVPIPWGFRPGTVAIEPSNVPLNEDRGLVMSVVDRNQILVVITGKNFTHRPHTTADLRATVADLAGQRHGAMAPWLVDAVEYLEEHEEECKPFFTEANCRAFNWVKYYEAPRGSLPRNFIAVGDAMVTLNPNGAYGTSKAMYDAVTLDACLRKTKSIANILPQNFSKTFFRTQAPRARGMWWTTKDSDYAWSATTPVPGKTLDDGSIRRHFMAQVGNLSAKDPEVYSQVWHVMGCLAPMTDLLAPWFLVRVARQWLFG